MGRLNQIIQYKKACLIAIFLIMSVGIFAYKYLGSYYNAPPMMPPIPVSVIVATIADTPVDMNFSGITEGSKIVEIKPRVSGILEKVTFTEGMVVKEGQPLFHLESTAYDIALRGAQAELAKAESQYAQAIREEARIQQIVAKHALPQKALDDATSQKTFAKASVDAARAKLAETQLNKEYTVITAPVSGVISKVIQDEGSLLNIGVNTILAKIFTLDPIYVNFSIAEGEYVKIKHDISKGLLQLPPNNELNVKLYYGTNIPFTHIGHVDFMDTELSKGSGVVQMRAKFPNPENTLISGQFVRIVVKGGVRQQAIFLPRKAIVETPEGQQVFVVGEEGEVALKPVVLGDKIDNSVQIISGLNVGDKVVVEGYIKLKPGIKAQIIETIGSNATPEPKETVSITGEGGK